VARLSPIPGERQMQTQILLLVGWATVGFIVFRTGIGGVRDHLTLVQAVLGTVYALVALRLPLLVRRHRQAIEEVYGLRGQYALAAYVTIGYGVLGIWFFGWGGLVGVVIGFVALVMTRRITPLPEERMTQRIDYLDPEAHRYAGQATLEKHPVLTVVGLFLGVVLVVAVIVVLAVLFSG
jgi:hypothetical protein